MVRATCPVLPAMLFLGLHLLGCGGGEPEDPSAERVREETKEAAEAAKEHLAIKKEEFMNQVEARLRTMDARIEELKAKAEAAQAGAKAEYKEEIRKLETQYQDVQSQLKQLAGSSGKAWEDMKSGLEKATAELEKSVERAKERF